jgi:hypothetical protein
MTTLIDQSIAHLGVFRAVLWSIYLAAAVILPIFHLRPILRYVFLSIFLDLLGRIGRVLAMHALDDRSRNGDA